MGRILRLALLAPDIMEAILGGWADQRVTLDRLGKPIPTSWQEQRAMLERLGRPLSAGWEERHALTRDLSPEDAGA